MSNSHYAMFALVVLGCGGAAAVPVEPVAPGESVETVAPTEVASDPAAEDAKSTDADADLDSSECGADGDCDNAKEDGYPGMSDCDDDDFDCEFVPPSDGASARVLATLPTIGGTLTTLRSVSWALKPNAHYCGGQQVVISVAAGSHVSAELTAFINVAEPLPPYSKDGLNIYFGELIAAWTDIDRTSLTGSPKALAFANAVEISSLLVGRTARLPRIAPTYIDFCDLYGATAEAFKAGRSDLAKRCRIASAAERITTYDAICAE